MSGCRIGRVRWKGPTLVNLDRPQRSGRADTLVAHASTIAGYERPDSRLAAHVVLAVYDDGSISTGMRHYSDCPVSRWLLPVLLAEVVREGLVSTPEAQRAVGRMLDIDAGVDWPEDPDAA